MYYTGYINMATTANHKFKNYAQTTKKNNPVGICLLKVNNRNTTTRCEICSKLKIKTPE